MSGTEQALEHDLNGKHMTNWRNRNVAAQNIEVITAVMQLGCMYSSVVKSEIY